MNAKHMWICLFLVFYSAQSPCTACTWITSGEYRIKSKESLSQLLRAPHNCFTITVLRLNAFEETVVSFHVLTFATQFILVQADDQVKFLAEVTEQISELFNADLDAVKWKEQALDHFLSILKGRQLKELKNCVSVQKEYYSPTCPCRNYSADSWEQIRRLVRSHLMRMDIIASNLKSAMDSQVKSNLFI
uniref:Uncharacterized protein n=1 Tax=Electrophorus electricus TaxID=8005 RepID=A0A4W4FFP6_ELEEL